MANQSNTEQQNKRHERRTSNTYNKFLNELCTPGDMSKEEAEKATVAVLGALEKRIQPTETSKMEAQLPQKLRELLDHSGIDKSLAPQRFGKDEFIEMVASDLDASPEEAESTSRRVFATVRAQISDGEAEDVASQLPLDIAQLWREQPT
ncbi:DUF2267 domain-containing protein [Halovibrio sp. HP20-50]|uniref:DUF2267 domain-containing protein n=1 Tax=Halovibrio sp. HP20-59 TaxID=3080275 RepID=UPI00294B1B20|nr:DUF2267 domain-containing protein [Halovibrio sp. HP20-59]MEA2119271.1 DUF2267 domain-containing protein [Halovibrio sp. HP20-59]